MGKYKIIIGANSRPDIDIEREVLASWNTENEYELVQCAPRIDPEGFYKEAADADAICAFIPFPPEVLDKLPKCQVIAIPALGTDFCYNDAATERGICMTNLPVSYCLEEVASHTCALVLDCARHVTAMAAELNGQENGWKESRKQRGILRRLKGSIMGFCSFGRIARRTAEMMRGFGVEIAAYDPFLPDEVFTAAGAKRIDTLEELFAQCDIISVQTPPTPKTYHMINKELFDIAKPDLILVCCGRGGVIDEDALKAALLDHKIFAAGIDVIEDEVTFHSVLFGVPGAIVTPHTAYYTDEAEQDIHRINMNDMLTVLEKKEIPANLVNTDVAGRARFQK